MVPSDWMLGVMKEAAFGSPPSGGSSQWTDAALMAELESVGLGEGAACDAAAANPIQRSEAKRRKHRESMARLRSERRTSIQALEKQEKALHERLKRVLAWVESHRSHHASSGCHGLKFVKLVRVGEKLRLEQYTLEAGLHQWHKYTNLVKLHARRLNQDPSYPMLPGRADAEAARDPTGYWVSLLDDEAPLFYEYEAYESSMENIRRGLEAIAHTRSILLDPCGLTFTAHCLGWELERSLRIEQLHGRPTLRFRFSRRVSRRRTTVQHLEDATWQMLNSPELMARTYGSAVVTKVVQRVNDDAFILLRNSPTSTNHTRFRYFNLNARVRSGTEPSTQVLMMILSKTPRQHELEQRHDPSRQVDNVVWVQQGGACLRFTQVSSEKIEIEYTGYIECVSDDHANHLTIESSVSLLRWEHLVVPPQLLAA